VPIVFVLVPDPVGSGFVHSLSQPGGNATGFMTYEYNLCGKWPELPKEIAPGVTRAAVVAVIQSVAPSVGVEVIPVNLSEDPAELEREVAAFAQTANGGLIMTAGVLSATHRDLIVTLAAQHKLPAVYQERN
jgi:putative ABC transport system substrate-binding protein